MTSVLTATRSKRWKNQEQMGGWGPQSREVTKQSTAFSRLNLKPIWSHRWRIEKM